MSFVAITDYAEQRAKIAPLLERMGKKLPAEGTAVVFAEIDDAGEILAFQVIQNAIFFEGLWSGNRRSHLRGLWNYALEWMRNNGVSGDVYTMAADPKIVNAAQAMGCELMPWRILRKRV